MKKSSKPTFYDVEKVIRELVIPFGAIERAVPIPRGSGVWRSENDAEHSWSLALVACMLAPHINPRMDIGKVCQFAVVHDLVEIYAGDTSAFAVEHEHSTKEEREHAALSTIQTEFAHFPWLTDMLTEYEQQTCEEAQYVRSIDKFVPLVFDHATAGYYYHQNKHTKEDFVSFMARPREKAKVHPGAFAYHEEAMAVLLAMPHLFHPSKQQKL